MSLGVFGGSSGSGSGSLGGIGGFGSGTGGVSMRKGIVNRRREQQSGAVSGTAVVVVLLTIVAAVGGGLIWYKQQPQALPPALNDDNGVMLLIPAGPFVYGPERTQGVAHAFYIDRTEVTNRMYAEFCRRTGHPLPPGFPADGPNLPVVNVTIEDAATFAKWAGKRLPDALEWEKAYRGSDGRLCPWGNEMRPTPPTMAIADSNPELGSPYNILHMATNVREFTRTLSPSPDPQVPHYQVRGGSFDTTEAPWNFDSKPGTFRSANTGFRCAKDPPRR